MAGTAADGTGQEKKRPVVCQNSEHLRSTILFFFFQTSRVRTVTPTALDPREEAEQTGLQVADHPSRGALLPNTPSKMPPPKSVHQRQNQGQRSPNATAASAGATNVTRGRPMVSGTSRLRRPMANGGTGGTGGASLAKSQLQPAAVSAAPLTQTTKRLFQRNSYGGSSVPNSPVKAAINQQQQQHQRQKALSAQNSPGTSRSTSPHQLQQQQQQQMRRRSANYIMESQDEEDPPSPPGYQQGPPHRMVPGSSSGLPRMSQQQYHRSQPQLSAAQQSQYKQGGGGSSRLLYSSHQQLSRGAGGGTRLGTSSYQQQQQHRSPHHLPPGGRVDQQHQQLQQQHLSNGPADRAAGARSFGLPSPGFASSSRGGSSYVQKSM